MTRDDIIRWALEAGYGFIDPEMHRHPLDRLERLATMAFQAGAAAEREACADICDQHASVEGIAQRCAEQIRGRGKT